MAAPKLFTDEELAMAAHVAQGQNPMLSESAVMGVLGVSREYLAERAKRSVRLTEVRAELQAIRERAWLEKGIEGMSGKSEVNPTLYIWMSKNVLGWRDKPADEKEQPTQGQSLSMNITPELARQFIKAARGEE